MQRARIVLDEKSIPHQIEFIDLANRPDWFAAISPLGKVPVVADYPLRLRRFFLERKSVLSTIVGEPEVA